MKRNQQHWSVVDDNDNDFNGNNDGDDSNNDNDNHDGDDSNDNIDDDGSTNLPTIQAATFDILR